MKKIFLLIICLLLCACNNKVDGPIVSDVPETENILIYENNEFEYGEVVKLKDIFKNEEIMINEEYLDTNKIGENSVSIIYTKDELIYQEKFNYIIKDTTPPLVYLGASYSITTDFKKELDKAIPCVDNYDKNPDCHIEGDYNTKKVGRYKLKYVGKDSNGNTTEKQFVLIVNKPSKPTYANTKTKIEDVIKKYKNDNTMIGIDVSKWQGEIDWAKVKKSGVEFAMIRIATQVDFKTDEIREDQYFKANIEGAIANGIEVGIYFFSYATSEKEVIDQAKYIIDKVNDYEITMPIAYDWESYGSLTGKYLSLTDFRNNGYTFMKTLEDAGYHGILYGSKNYLNNFWQPIKSDTWLAHYTANLNKSNYDKDYIMWQLCNNGVVNGIDGYVDLDIYYK